jgi:hypothetical protein
MARPANLGFYSQSSDGAKFVPDIVIAERNLLYSSKGDAERNFMTIRLIAPCSVEEGSVGFLFDAGTARCVVEFEPLGKRFEFFGMDTLQALELAVRIDPYLKGLTAKYDFYWMSGEGYFDDP